MRELDGKVVLVTGGGSGIGRHTALAFGELGSKVIVADIAADAGQETARMIKDGGGLAVFVTTDVTQAGQVEALIQTAVEFYGSVDCAFNNAGINGQDGKPTFITVREQVWDLVISINLKGIWLCMKYEIEQMLRQGGGIIVNNASVAGLVGMTGNPAYVASKHGVVGLTKAAALEYASAGIRVNAVCPASIRTPMVERVLKARPELEAHVTNMQPIGRMGTPNEVAQAVLWLCSDRSSFVTGQALAIDGGLLAGQAPKRWD